MKLINIKTITDSILSLNPDAKFGCTDLLNLPNVQDNSSEVLMIPTETETYVILWSLLNTSLPPSRDDILQAIPDVD